MFNLEISRSGSYVPCDIWNWVISKMVCVKLRYQKFGKMASSTPLPKYTFLCAFDSFDSFIALKSQITAVWISPTIKHRKSKVICSLGIIMHCPFCVSHKMSMTLALFVHHTTGKEMCFATQAGIFLQLCYLLKLLAWEVDLLWFLRLFSNVVPFFSPVYPHHSFSPVL